MIYKNFKVNFLVRILLLTATIFLFVYLILETKLIITLVLIGVLIIIQIYNILNFTDQTNRMLYNFLESIRYSDFSRTFELDGNDSSFEKLKNSFNEVIKDFQEVREEKEENFYYLQSIIQHIGIALIAYKEDGSVELINNATKKLFQIKSLSNIQQLSSFSPELAEQLKNIKHGENTLIKVVEEDNILQLIIFATEFKIHSRSITLVSIKNIQQELEENEMQSWQKLIRVLTHEIMNSITPISSLSSTVTFILKDLSESLEKQGIQNEDIETIGEVHQALETIQKRTDGLTHFVNTYRNLTQVPAPNYSIFKVTDLISNISQLFKEEIKAKNIALKTNITPASIELSADKQLIEQVIINVIKNAIHALENHPHGQIHINAFLNKQDRITIQISDNGPGILPNVLERIFIPFFTTKPKGSGIGLSLSKQILRLHGGTITAQSEPDKETRFTLTF